MFQGIPGTCSSKAISAIVVAMKNNYEYGIEGVIGKEAKVVSKLGSLSDA
jgi:uncharacterized protein YeeX (DUF496 family)